LSTLEMGHINGFPLKMDTSTPSRFPFVGYCHEPDADKVNGTAFDWVQCTAGELFSGLRELGAYSREETIVQVNHPRDTILGYFNEFYLNPYTAEPERPTGDNVANYPEAGYFVYPHDRAPGQFAPENFSWDFEAIEVFNGKRMDMLHGFSLAEDIPAEYYEDLQDPCLDGHPENGPGKPLLRKGGYIAYPGVVDDWMNMLNVGLKFTATGNSDSHSLSAEVGTPRTYIWVAPDEAGARDEYPTMVHELDIVDSIKKHRALVTNGPFLNMAVSTAAADSSSDILPWPVGSTVLYSDSNVGREVNLVLEMRWPQWMLVDTILIYANGKVVKEIDVVAQEGERNGGSFHYFTTTYTSTFDVDTYLVAEARSSHSLFPVMTPNESPPTNVSEVLGAITAGMGTSTTSAQDGVLSPAYVQKVFPYALTNPIWLDIDANGTFDPPGNDAGPAPAENPAEGCPEEGKSLAESPEFRDSLKGLRDHKAYDPLDVREIFNAPEKR
ncbi:hypothetical protein KAI87_10440, partial [Myxococcota bacterium]|nr:hypothetical protein [Myxococcota bacterium]